MKRGVIDAEQTFSETFKPIIEPLNLIVDKKSENQSIQREKHSDQSLKDEEADHFNKTSLYQFTHFFEIPAENRIYDKTYGLYFEKGFDGCKQGNIQSILQVILK